jgi:hypothetical protein
MATSFKAINNNDVTRARTKLHENIPITGSIVSGSAYLVVDDNIKTYPHGMFQSVYDYPYLSSSANHILDVTAGWAPDALISSSLNVSMRSKKNDLYNEIAQMLAGYNTTGSINKLDVSGNFGNTVALDKMNDVFVLNFARLLTKDEIQKTTGASAFNITLGVSSSYLNAFDKLATVYDKDGTNAKTNSPAGEFNVLYITGSNFTGSAGWPTGYQRPCGLVFYQAGVAVVTASVFQSDFWPWDCDMDSAGLHMDEVLVSGTINDSATAVRHRIRDLSFNNTTELNSTIYFCRANHSEFNYSSNPTYLSSSQIRVKTISTDNPVSFATTVGLYSDDNALLAVAKVSEPITKSPSTEYTLRVRLDY